MKDYELLAPTGEAEWRAYHDIRRAVLFEARGQFGVYQEDRPDDGRRATIHNSNSIAVSLSGS